MAAAAVCAMRFAEEAVDEAQPETMQWMIGLDDAVQQASQHFEECINFMKKCTTGDPCRIPRPQISYLSNPSTIDCQAKETGNIDFVEQKCRITQPYQFVSAILFNDLNISSKLESTITSSLISIPNLFESPPSYNDSISDVPPDYTTTTELASQKLDYIHTPPPPYAHSCTDRKRTLLIRDPIANPCIDFSTTHNVRQHANKKAKQAAKKAQKDKWADGDEGGTAGAGGEDGEQNGDGAAGGSGGAGSGGGGNGGDGGDDEWDDVGAGKGKKGKKNKKKSAFAWDEEEDEQKKKEEEAQKVEDETGKNVWDDEPTNGGDVQPNDAWGEFAQVGSKKNKKKNKKVNPYLRFLQIRMFCGRL